MTYSRKVDELGRTIWLVPQIGCGSGEYRCTRYYIEGCSYGRFSCVAVGSVSSIWLEETTAVAFLLTQGDSK